MTNIKIGSDIVKNSRVNNEKLIKKFLSQRELYIYSSFEDKTAKLTFASGRWAGKEAIIKASNKKYTYKNIEILNDKNGHPIIFIDKFEDKNIKLSISHEIDYSISFCLIII